MLLIDTLVGAMVGGGLSVLYSRPIKNVVPVKVLEPVETQSLTPEAAYDPQAASKVEDPNSVANLAKTHPTLAKVCKMAGSCEAVTLECTETNGEKTVWVRVPGASFSDPMSGGGLGPSVESASAYFIKRYHEKVAEGAYKAAHPDPVTVVVPCTGDCK